MREVLEELQVAQTTHMITCADDPVDEDYAPLVYQWAVVRTIGLLTGLGPLTPYCRDFLSQPYAILLRMYRKVRKHWMFAVFVGAVYVCVLPNNFYYKNLRGLNRL